MTIYHQIASKFPALKMQLRIAHSNYTPDQFVKKTATLSVMYAVVMTIVFFFVFKKGNINPIFLIAIFPVLFIFFFQYFLLTIKGAIRKRQREIDKEILFAGRNLLVKLHSGEPLLNSLMDTSKSYGVASMYFKEIVDEINTGTPIETALENAMNFSPSDKFRKILFQLNNALKLGIDVTKPLESVIDDITNEQELEIKKYGKKLNSIVIFYLLAAVVVPSLGMTLFIVVASFLKIQMDLLKFMVVGFFLILIQVIFISIFKSIRPMVNI